MSFAIEVMNAFDSGNVDAVADLCHEDMVYVDDYEMYSREDWLALLKRQFDDGSMPDFSRARSILLDRRDIFSMEFVRDIDGVLHRVTNVGLKRDNKFWRFQVNCVPI